MNVAVYVRVSTDDQNPEMQINSCRKFCEEKGYSVIKEYIDKKSGRTEKRPQFQQMKKDAIFRRFDTVVIWKMDRLTRGTIREVVKILEWFSNYKINVVSVTEPYLNTDNPSSELILLVMAWCANIESKRIGERVKAGIKNWTEKNPDKRWRGKEWDIGKAIELREQGVGWRSIEKILRDDGCDITWAGIRKELIKRGINLPTESLKEEEEQKTD